MTAAAATIRRSLIAAWVLCGAACTGPVERRAVPADGSTVEAATRVLGEASSRTAPVRVQIVEARRIKSDTLRLELVVHNLAAPGSDAAGAVAEVVGALGALSILTADRQRRLFPLHDAEGRPVASRIEVPAPGERHSFWMLFPAQPPDGGPITVVLPGLGTVPNVPVD